MKRIGAIMLAGFAVAAAAPAWAGKISMAKEGGYELRFCTVGSGTVITANEQVFAMQYSGVALLSTQPPGGAFDRQSAKCWGTLGIVRGKADHLGYCEMVDMDGDKWLMEYHGAADSSGGTYTAVSGTGKYEGMTLKGEYRIDGYPALGADGYAGCHLNKGTYKLK